MEPPRICWTLRDPSPKSYQVKLEESLKNLRNTLSNGDLREMKLEKQMMVRRTMKQLEPSTAKLTIWDELSTK